MAWPVAGASTSDRDRPPDPARAASPCRGPARRGSPGWPWPPRRPPRAPPAACETRWRPWSARYSSSASSGVSAPAPDGHPAALRRVVQRRPRVARVGIAEGLAYAEGRRRPRACPSSSTTRTESPALGGHLRPGRRPSSSCRRPPCRPRSAPGSAAQKCAYVHDRERSVRLVTARWRGTGSESRSGVASLQYRRSEPKSQVRPLVCRRGSDTLVRHGEGESKGDAGMWSRA